MLFLKKIVVDLIKKSSEKDIAKDNDVSSNSVEGVIDSYYDTQKLYKIKTCEPLNPQVNFKFSYYRRYMQFFTYNNLIYKITILIIF